MGKEVTLHMVNLTSRNLEERKGIKDSTYYIISHRINNVVGEYGDGYP